MYRERNGNPCYISSLTNAETHTKNTFLNVIYQFKRRVFPDSWHAYTHKSATHTYLVTRASYMETNKSEYLTLQR